jgi:hypothetical protein
MDKYVVLPNRTAQQGDVTYSEGQIISGLLREHALFHLKSGSIRPFEEEIDAPKTEVLASVSEPQGEDSKVAKKTK